MDTDLGVARVRVEAGSSREAGVLHLDLGVGRAGVRILVSDGDALVEG